MKYIIQIKVEDMWEDKTRADNLVIARKYVKMLKEMKYKARVVKEM